MKRLLPIACALAFAACDLSFVNESVNNNNNPAGPSANPTPTPSPSPGGVAPAVATLNVAEYGREGQPGCGTGDQLGFRAVEPYCRVLITCTPRDEAGNDIGSKLPPPEWFNANPTTLNPWNARGECSSGSGTVVFGCAVGGKSDTRTYTCVPAGT